jgi:single-stranded-DNA-specific exonuclease
MTGENRVLAYFGLQVINSDPRPGIKALVHQAKKQT